VVENDARHRTGGPAREEYTNVKFTSHDDLVEMTAEAGRWEWYTRDVAGNPYLAEFQNLHRVLRDQTPVELYAEYVGSTTTTVPMRGRRMLSPTASRLAICTKPIRTGNSINAPAVSRQWNYLGQIIPVDPIETGYPQDYHLANVDLWGWPFYKDSATEYLMFEEFQKMRK